MSRATLERLLQREREHYRRRTPASERMFEASDHLFGRVPMTWMSKWSGGYPLYLAEARGGRVVDVDGREYADFSLGDTAAMAGHSPEPLANALRQQMSRRAGVSTMMPTEDGEWVGAELSRRFGLPLWSFTLSATDANRWALRLARMVTERPKVLAFSYCYHGSVDETFVVRGPRGAALLRPGNVGAPVRISTTTRVAEFNDLDSVEQQLAAGDVAVVITEPALTNIGIILPEPGFLEGLRELCSKHGTLLLLDETHTISAGPGGCTQAWGLQPDIVTIGKSLGGGVPAGAYGLTAALADRIRGFTSADLIDTGGVGGTLAGNALSLAAMRAILGQVLTDEAFPRMTQLATRYSQDVDKVFTDLSVPWTISQLGARAEYRFTSPMPRTGTASAAAGDPEIEEYLHLYMANRGILLSPFHNMALMCPATSRADVVLHAVLFREAMTDLLEDAAWL